MSNANNAPLTERAYRTLRNLILENEIRAGEQILEKVLVEKLNISRTPVREACVQLEREGLIEIRPRRGIYVKPISASDMNEIYDVLTALESKAASLLAEKSAAQGLSDQELNALEQPTTDMQLALERNDLTAWAVADEAFHLALLNLCGNQRLKEAVLKFWGQAHRVRYSTLELREKPTDSTFDHQAVVAAIRNGDAAKAAKIHSEHRQKGKRTLLAIIEKLRVEQL